MKKFLLITMNIALILSASAQDYSRCTITNSNGEMVGVLDYQKGALILDTVDVKMMPDFARELNRSDYVVISQTDGRISTNSGSRSMNTGVAASRHVKSIIEDDLRGLYQIRCQRNSGNSSHWGGRN